MTAYIHQHLAILAISRYVVVSKIKLLLGFLTHWGGDKMAAISQTTFSNLFTWMKMSEFRLEFLWNMFLRVQLTIPQHWFRQWLGTGKATSHCLNHWQLASWPIYASLGLNELRYLWFQKCFCSPGPVFCLLFRVSSGCAQPITGQVTSVIGWAMELYLSCINTSIENGWWEMPRFHSTLCDNEYLRSMHTCHVSYENLLVA